MTSIFRIIDRNFDPPPTVRNNGVKPSQHARGVSIADVDAGLLAACARAQRRERAQAAAEEPRSAHLDRKGSRHTLFCRLAGWICRRTCR